jgi:hypothetical protein
MIPSAVKKDLSSTSSATSSTRRNRKRQQRLDGLKSNAQDIHTDVTLTATPASVVALGGSGAFSGGRQSPSPAFAQQQPQHDTAAAGCQKKHIDLYDPDLTEVCINALVSSLVYVPSHDRRERTQQPPYVLCREFVLKSSCALGDECIFVHGSMTEASSLSASLPKPIHVNLKYASLERARYPRLPPGDSLTVMAPNGRPPGTQVASDFVFATQGSLLRNDESRMASRKPLSHCAHYYFNRVCNRGANCSFIHVVCIANADDADEDADVLAGTASVLRMLARPPTANHQQPQQDHPSADLQQQQLHNAGDVPVIKISRASPIRKPLPGSSVQHHMDPQSQTMVHQSSQHLLTLLAPPQPNVSPDDRAHSLFLTQGGITSPSTLSGNDSVVFLDGAPPSLHGSFATSNATPSTLGGDDEQFNRGLTPGSSRPATPHRCDSFRSQPPKSPILRAVTVGSKTLLFAPVAQPKDKDGSSPAGSVEGIGGGSDGNVEAATTPVSFRHNPYGTPSSRNVTPTMD